MTDWRWHEIWKEQCEAAEAIMFCYGVESAFDYVVGEKLLNFAAAAAKRPEFARALPSFVSRVRRMFTPEELQEHLARIEHLRLQPAEAAPQEREASLDGRKAATGRARQLELVRNLLTAPALATR